MAACARTGTTGRAWRSTRCCCAASIFIGWGLILAGVVKLVQRAGVHEEDEEPGMTASP